MPKRRRYRLFFAPEVVRDLDAVERKYHTLIRRQIRIQLLWEPEVESRNRKALEVPAPFGARWKLQSGPRNRFRVFYEVEPEAGVLSILAIGEKDRQVLRVGREEYQPRRLHRVRM